LNEIIGRTHALIQPIGLRVFLLATLNPSSDHISSNIVVLTEVEELPNLRHMFRPKSPWENGVGQRGDLGITLFDNDEAKDGDIRSNDTATNRFASTFASVTSSVARVFVGKKGLA
jgi:hypothetical protein